MNIKKISLFLSLFILIATAAFLFKDNSHPKNSFNVYFVKDEKVLPLKRTVNPSVNGKISDLNYAIEELLKGPTVKESSKGYLTEIPFATNVLSIKENPESFIINLSNDFQSGGGSLSMALRLDQLIKTASGTSEGKKVYLFINGKKPEYIGGEGLIVPSPLNKSK